MNRSPGGSGARGGGPGARLKTQNQGPTFVLNEHLSDTFGKFPIQIQTCSVIHLYEPGCLSVSLSAFYRSLFEFSVVFIDDSSCFKRHVESTRLRVSSFGFCTHLALVHSCTIKWVFCISSSPCSQNRGSE